MIYAAAERLRGRVRVTPMLSSPFMDRIAGRTVCVKAECLQHTGSFKYRGALSALTAMTPEARRRGVIAYSSGNHAQGVARAAAEHGAPCVIVMPADAPAIKIANTRAMGAEVVLYNREIEDRDAIGRRLAEDRALTLVKPFDDPQVIAGQGTCGIEIADQAAGTGVGRADVLVCCGGGGLSSGIAVALADLAPGLRVRTVEPEGFDDVARSLAAGRVVRNAASSGSVCDAILTPAPGETTFPILSRLCGPGIAVTDDEAMRAMAIAFARLKIVLEPGGAVSLAAALFHGEKFEGDSVICVATGGNVDTAVLNAALIRHGTGD
jgi:threonine dehydratase